MPGVLRNSHIVDCQIFCVSLALGPEYDAAPNLEATAKSICWKYGTALKGLGLRVLDLGFRLMFQDLGSRTWRQGVGVQGFG